MNCDITSKVVPIVLAPKFRVALLLPMDEINDLVLSPFREVVSHGTVGVRNAGLAGDERMLKTAQELVKEGERALSRLEALCQRRVGQFGASFVNALKYNGKS